MQVITIFIQLLRSMKQVNNKMNKFFQVIEKIAHFFMKYILKVFHVEWDDEKWKAFYQFIRFCVIGVSNTIISYAINVVVLLLLQPLSFQWDYFIANLTAFFLSVLWSFFWNDRYVFLIEDKSERSTWKALIKTYISYGFSGVLVSNVLLWIWVSVLHISKYIAPLINLIVSVPLNFVMNKLWAFKSKTE